MADSILTTTKRTLGLAEDYTVFDPEIIMHINSVFGTLNQLGLGPDVGFEITDASQQWSEFLGGELRYSPVKSYMYLRVQLLFDSSTMTGPVLQAKENMVKEMEWRLAEMRTELVHPIDPDPFDPEEDDEALVLDGGTTP